MTNLKVSREMDPKLDDIAGRLEELARNAALISFAVTGIMELRQGNEEQPLRDAADQIDGHLRAIAGELRA